MVSPLPRLRLSLAVLATGLLTAPAWGGWDSLLGKSPFGQIAVAASGDQAPTELEFRGIVDEGNVRLVNLYDPAAKKSRWVEVNGANGDLRVLAFDGRTNQVQVSNNGQLMTLPFKRATVALVQAAPPAPIAAAGPAREGGEPPENMSREERRAAFRAQMRARLEANGGPLPRALSPEDIAVMQEVRRRRALRDGTPPPPPIETPSNSEQP